ncbi:hypothetical protein TNIN_253301 [Trichonephila inaurata madagascariensis]|uniref:Uncharacterized protein n=1 Tax=Trichonephila inaurata madagascariensis TaxID=2747483 RepID=A0A8X6XTX3_9ARAC|nr:hypothetical protein TNIN_253301 [Trichonephila inaurata madagascariensis]
MQLKICIKILRESRSCPSVAGDLNTKHASWSPLHNRTPPKHIIRDTSATATDVPLLNHSNPPVSAIATVSNNNRHSHLQAEGPSLRLFICSQSL